MIRGFYMSAAAWVKHVGTPIDLPLYRRFSMNAGALRSAFIEKHADRFDVYERGRFNFDKYESFIAREGLLAVWPRTPKGRLATSGKTLERLAETHPIVGEFLLFLATVDLLEGIGSSFNEAGEIEEDEDKAEGLRINADGRNHAALFPFGAKTSRNTPRGRAFLFTNPAWMRFLIRPEKGRAIAYLDWARKNCASPPPAPAIRLCWRCASAPIPTSNSRSLSAWRRQGRRKNRIRPLGKSPKC